MSHTIHTLHLLANEDLLENATVLQEAIKTIPGVVDIHLAEETQAPQILEAGLEAGCYEKLDFIQPMLLEVPTDNGESTAFQDVNGQTHFSPGDAIPEPCWLFTEGEDGEARFVFHDEETQMRYNAALHNKSDD